MPRHTSHFNPRTREGCDPNGEDACVKGQEFQSTHPRGVRLRKAAHRIVVLHISIHAPARGATPQGRAPHRRPSYFNPRTREGCDGALGADRQDAPRISIHAPARGATKRNNALSSAMQISIHAPARGATAPRYSRKFLRRISIHAPARGATDADRVRHGRFDISIHAPARGAT